MVGFHVKRGVQKIGATGHLCCICCLDTSWFGGYLGWWRSRGWQFLANEQSFLFFFLVDWRYEQNIDITEFDGVGLSLIWKICLIENRKKLSSLGFHSFGVAVLMLAVRLSTRIRCYLVIDGPSTLLGGRRLDHRHKWCKHPNIFMTLSVCRVLFYVCFIFVIN